VRALLQNRRHARANRQALFSDPDFARALYRHIRQTFPKEAKAAFRLYFENLCTNAPGLLDEIQKEWDASAEGATKKRGAKKGGA
jgi:hypothetical protein